MNTYSIIFKKRNGVALDKAEIEFIVSGFLSGSIPDYQMSAFLMAVFYMGMTEQELNEFTRIMLESGQIIDLSGLGRETVDKHSTGGVGDGVSLVLAPLVASFGVVVPMMSGRGLGHTGGTLDKLESIPGFNVSLSVDDFKSQLIDVGVAMIGQTENIAPADKKMYALRDVTATVDSIELISASIMSKKLAEGAKSLILDVKTGSGAFMKEMKDAKKLADKMIDIGKHYGRNMTAVISDMSQPLGNAVGNANEIRQALDIMTGRGPEDICSLIIELSANMLVMSGVYGDIVSARDNSLKHLSGGQAMETFRKMVQAQGGDPQVCEKPEDILASPSYSFTLESSSAGYISAMDTTQIGMAALSLGAGRRNVEDNIDFSAGLEVLKKLGDRVEKGEPLAEFYSSAVSDFDGCRDIYLKAVTIEEDAPEKPELIYEVIR